MLLVGLGLENLWIQGGEFRKERECSRMTKVLVGKEIGLI